VDYPPIPDDQLERLEEAYVEAARCAFEAGFEGVDVKACHPLPGIRTARLVHA